MSSYKIWADQERALFESTPQTYQDTLYEAVRLLIEDAKERALKEECYE